MKQQGNGNAEFIKTSLILILFFWGIGYLVQSFTFWDWAWFSGIPEWGSYDRFGVAFYAAATALLSIFIGAIASCPDDEKES